MQYAIIYWFLGSFLTWTSTTLQDQTDTKILPDVVYGHKDGMALTYDVFLPPEERRNGAGILFMASGGWVSFWMDPQEVIARENPMSIAFRQLLARGYVIYIVRHGSAPRYKVPDAVKDVKRAVEHVRAEAPTYGVDPNRLGASGLSAGGHLSLVLGTMGQTDENGKTVKRPPVSAVVAWFPPTSLVEVMDLAQEVEALDFDPALADGLSPRLHVDRADAPALLLHGDSDEIVPLEHSILMQEEMRSAGVEVQLEVFEGEGHTFTPVSALRSMNMMFEFFDNHLANLADEKEPRAESATSTN